MALRERPGCLNTDLECRVLSPFMCYRWQIMADIDTLDIVSLDEDLPQHGLRRGAVGTVLHRFEHPRPAYEVEFCDPTGRTIAQLALRPEQVVPVASQGRGRHATG